MSDYEVELRGVTLTCDAPSELGVSGFQGLGGPVVDSSLRPYTGRDGTTFQGPDRLRERRLVFTGVIRSDSDLEALSRLQEVLEAWSTPVRTGTLLVRIRLAGTDFVAIGRPGQPDADVQDLPQGVIRVRLPFTCSDPRLLSETEESAALALGGDDGGFVFPATFPWAAEGGSGMSDPSVLNAGRVETHWRATLVGPLNSPSLTLSTTGEVLNLEGNIPAGSSLTLDSRSRSVKLDGSPRPSWVSLDSTWWLLPVGSSIIRLRAVSGTGSGTFYWRSAWL